MLGQIGEQLIRKLERIIGLPHNSPSRNLRRLMGLTADRCDIALFRRLNFECMETRTMFSANLGFAFGSGDNNDDVGYEVATDGDGNIYMTGEFRGTVDFDFGAGVSNLVTGGDSDVFIAKYTADGDLLWAKQLGGGGDDSGYSLTVDGDGNVYVTGMFDGSAPIDFDPGADTDMKAGAGTENAFVLKLDATGDYAWSATFNGVNKITAHDLEVDASGNVFVGGGFWGTADFDPLWGAVAPIASNGDEDAFLAKLDATGRVSWVQTFGGARDEAIMALDLDSSGNIVTTGYFESFVDFDPGAGTSFMFGGGGYDAFVSKFDSAGSYQWSISATSSGDNFGMDVVVDSNDDIVYVGSFEGTVDFNPGAGTSQLTSYGNSDGFVVKLDSTGAYVWSGQLGGTNDDVAHGVDVDANDNIFVVGEFRGLADLDPDSVDSETVLALGSVGAFATKLDGTGNFVWATASQGLGTAAAYGVAVDVDGRMITTGYIQGIVDLDPTALVESVESLGNDDLFLQVIVENTTPTTTGIDDVTVAEDGADIVVDLFDAFADAESSDGDLTFTVVGNTNASLFSSIVIDGAGGTLTMQLGGDAFGTSVITVRATDSFGAYVETSFTVTINAVNDDPTTTGIDDVTVVEDSVDTVIDLHDAFADVEDGSAGLTYTITGNSNAALFSNVVIDGGAGTLTLSYAANANGTSVIRVRATDADGKYVETTFLVTVNSDNDQPTTVGISNVTVAEDSASTTVNLNAAFADADGDELTYSVTGNTNAALFADITIDSGAGTLTLRFAANKFGTAEITIRASDGMGAWVETTFNVTVTPVNDSPTAGDDNYAMWQNSTLVSRVDLLDNDADVDGDELVATLVNGPRYGQLLLYPNGTFVYTPQLGFYGVDQFTYRADDGEGSSELATVTLSVARLPTTSGDHYSMGMNAELNVETGEILSNDTFGDVVNPQVVLVRGPSNGTVKLNSDGSFLYVPNEGYTGQDTFAYKLTGSGAQSAAAEVTIDVLPPPSVLDDGGSGIDNPFGDPSDDILNEPAVNVIVSSSSTPPKAVKSPYSYYAYEVAASNINDALADSPEPVYENYLLGGSGEGDGFVDVDYVEMASDDAGSESDGAGGGDELVADNGPLNMRTEVFATPVDDDLLLNSAYLEGDESAFVFDRIIEKSASVEKAGEENVQVAAAEAIETAAGGDEALVPWREQSGDLAKDAVDHAWTFADIGESELEPSESENDTTETHVDQSVLAVIASTIAAGHLSHRKRSAQRTVTYATSDPPSPQEDSQL